MRSLLYGIVLAAIAVNLSLSSPTGASSEKSRIAIQSHKSTGLLADARRPFARPTIDPITSRMNTADAISKGKGKLVDSDFQLDQYLSKTDPRRSKSTIIDRSSKMKLQGKMLASATQEKNEDDEQKRTSNAYTALRPGSSRWNIAQRRNKFNSLWEKENLNTNMDPVFLADKVFTLRAQGISPTIAGIYAGKLVRDKGDPKYEASYMGRMSKLTNDFSREMTEIKSNSYLSNLDSTKQFEMALEQAKGEGLSVRKYNHRNDPNGPLAKYEKSAQVIETVGQVMLNHLKKKKLDFYKMPLDQVEKETRGLEIKRMKPIQFTRALFRFIQHRRGEKMIDMAFIRMKRKYFQSKELKKAQRKKEEIQEE